LAPALSGDGNRINSGTHRESLRTIRIARIVPVLFNPSSGGSRRRAQPSQSKKKGANEETDGIGFVRDLDRSEVGTIIVRVKGEVSSRMPREGDKIKVVEHSTPSGVYEILAQWDSEAGVRVAERATMFRALLPRPLHQKYWFRN
jgi:hypothetical protein